MKKNLNGVKAVILAGGYGARISEETNIIPKPMVRIGDKPIIWHIMKLYSHYGINDFIICLGYKGYVFKEYFDNYFAHNSENITFDFSGDSTIKINKNNCESWRITLVETGLDTSTGGRIKAMIKNTVEWYKIFYDKSNNILEYSLKIIEDFNRK
jgi:glucose-1-phosphate cytidylyltransferase